MICRALILAMFLTGALTAATVTLVSGGNARATIVLAEEPTRAARLAAYELQYHVQQMTGAVLPIADVDAAPGGPRILVGFSAATEALGIDAAGFGPQEYLIGFRAGTLVLAGRDADDRRPVHYDPDDPMAYLTWPWLWDEQATLYATYDFLERCCGVRWFNPTEVGTVIPRRQDLSVTGADIRRRPFFEFRGGTITNGMTETYDAAVSLWPRKSEEYRDWEAEAFADLHARFPNSGHYLNAKRGLLRLHLLRNRVGGRNVTCNHSLHGYYSRYWEADPKHPERFVERRPEWFARHPDGTPIAGADGRPLQLCYSDAGLVARVAQDARDWFDNGDAHGLWYQTGRDFYPLEPMDNGSFCQCDACRPRYSPRAERLRTGFFSSGDHSDYLFGFVNGVAAQLAQTHPEGQVVTLAYGGHAAPPKSLTLPPNVAVQFCFSANRMVYDRPEYEHEVALLRQWAKQDRALYLWLYYTFPVEVARGWECFPGFFAHTVGEQFRLFRDLGVRGMFHCGYGQQVEAYVTCRLMDDPDLDVDVLLYEYFGQLYGPAGPHLRAFYTAVERIYRDPANYPNIVLGHQNEELAWGYLGTMARMADLETHIEQARAALGDAPDLALERRRLQLFVAGTWEYMRRGKADFQERKRAWRGGLPRRRGLLLSAPATGDPDAVDWSETTALVNGGTWETRYSEGSRRTIDAHLAHDGDYLYLRLRERGDVPAAAGERFQVFLAAQRDYPVRELTITATGDWTAKTYTAADEPAATDWDSAATVVSRRTESAWTTAVALPLARLLPGGAEPGARVFLNVARRSDSSTDEPVWIPTFGEFLEPSRLGEVHLDTREETVPADAGTPPAPVAEWTFDTLDDTAVNGPELAPGPFGSALALQARWRQYVDCGFRPEYVLTDALTLEAWVRPNRLAEGVAAEYPAIFGRGYEDGPFSLHIRPDYSVALRLMRGPADGTFFNPRDLTVAPGAWHHVTATWDGQTARLYVDGRQVGPDQPAAGPLWTTDQPLRIGWLGSYHFLDGMIDEVRVYDRALTPGQVWSRYRTTRKHLRQWLTNRKEAPE